MSPGPVEEAGATARGLIDALKQNPAVLALSLAQIVLLVFIFYSLNKASEARNLIIQRQFEFAHSVSELLAKCVVPGKTEGYATEPLKPIGEVPEPKKEP